ncbi:hypothetical protein [Streptomyces mutabilis]|uniref:hypothetical protein n=1 Tax=Streptomyces mutabilis TaxID=67332 RepID=UPI003691E6CF
MAADRTLSGILVEDGEGGWAQCEMNFAEWLYRYLSGEDMAGPNTSAFSPSVETIAVATSSDLSLWTRHPARNNEDVARR